MFTLGQSVQQLMHFYDHSQFWPIPSFDQFLLGRHMWQFVAHLTPSFLLAPIHPKTKITPARQPLLCQTLCDIGKPQPNRNILFKLPSYPGRAGGRKIRRGSRSRLSSSPPPLPPRPTTTTPTAVRAAMGPDSNSTRSNVKPRERFFQELTLLPQTMRWPCQHSEQQLVWIIFPPRFSSHRKRNLFHWLAKILSSALASKAKSFLRKKFLHLCPPLFTR